MSRPRAFRVRLAALIAGHDAVISAVHFSASDPAGLLAAAAVADRPDLRLMILALRW